MPFHVLILCLIGTALTLGALSLIQEGLEHLKRRRQASDAGLRRSISTVAALPRCVSRAVTTSTQGPPPARTRLGLSGVAMSEMGAVLEAIGRSAQHARATGVGHSRRGFG